MNRHQLPSFLVLLFASVVAVQAAERDGADLSVFHPEDYGAVGDGVRDDTAAIQQCIDLAAAVEADEHGRRGTVVLDGTYHVTRQVKVFDDTSPEHRLKEGPHWRVFHVPSGVTIQGDGVVTQLLGGESPRQTTTNCTYIFWVAAHPQHYDYQLLDGQGRRGGSQPVENVTIEGISIVGDPAGLHSKHSESSAIVISRGVDVVVRSVRFRHWHRSVKAMFPQNLEVTGCLVEDGRYIGIAVYGGRDCAISDNTLRGNTHLSGGIYINGSGFRVTGNDMTFTDGIFMEAVRDVIVEGNRITRSPYPMRVGYVASGGAHKVKVTGNEVRQCVAGLMVNNARHIEVVDNLLTDFVAPGGDYMIEPPNGYWGFGRDPAGINVVDSAHVTVRSNRVYGLNEGVPVGIRVAHTRFTADPGNCYAVAPTPDGEEPVNHHNRVLANDVRADSGYRVAYYVENQSDFVLAGNRASNDRQSRVIRSQGSVEGNKVDSEVVEVEEATRDCPRLILRNHPAHWDTPVPAAACRYSEPAPEANEYFPHPPTPADMDP